MAHKNSSLAAGIQNEMKRYGLHQKKSDWNWRKHNLSETKAKINFPMIVQHKMWIESLQYVKWIREVKRRKT